MADPALTVASDTICHIIVKAREFDAQDVETDTDLASNGSDDRMIASLEGHAGDPTEAELREFIDALDEDEQTELVALLWLGRGDGTLDDWDELKEQARELRNKRTADYLLGEPLLSDHLEAGLSAFGGSCTDFELGRL
ncbi:DUF3775 domain-containing protein [Reyranella sp.]|uniref:DUF3775 domain-containing protein n=3 Tax=Reyranella sp. TaxID=1929291 RepID=UPI003D112552